MLGIGVVDRRRMSYRISYIVTGVLLLSTHAVVLARNLSNRRVRALALWFIVVGLWFIAMSAILEE